MISISLPPVLEKFFHREKKTAMQSTNHNHWYNDKYHALKIQRNIMFSLMLLATIIAGTSTVTVSYIASQKSINPYVIEIDKKSGITTLVDQNTIKHYSGDKAVNDHFLVKYIRARELYTAQTYKDNASEVRVMSSEDVYSRFRSKMRSSRPDSPVNLFANAIDCSLIIRSIQEAGKNDDGDRKVQVRFTTEHNTRNKPIIHHKIATISFEYAQVNMNPDNRYINPLGFRVTSYIVNDENPIYYNGK